MADKGYWKGALGSRVSRRRALGAAGALGAGAAALALAGCGGGGTTGERQSSGLVSHPVDTTSQAKAGGTLKDFYTAEIANFDAVAFNTASTVNQVSVFAYSRLLKFETAKFPKIPDGSVTGEMAESFEISGDKLQFTFKLRPGMKWDPRPPTNGRVIDAQDVLWSWRKFGQVNASGLNLVYDAQRAPAGTVESISAPDNSTIVMKLRQPDASTLILLAAWDHFYTMPREADGGFDPRTEVRGYGPWQVEEYRPSAYIYWRKNPEYHVKDRPFFDRIERPLITEYSSRLAQFKAGNIYTSVVDPGDVVQTKRDVPQTLLRQAEAFPVSVGGYIQYGYDGDSPFRDQRLRKALSMSIDREAWVDALENRDQFTREGLELPVGFNTTISPGWGSAYLDPYNEKEFGPSHEVLKYNPTEAKKLMAAAGYPSGLEFDFHFNQEQTYGAIYHRMRDVYEGMFNAVGFKPRLKGYPYTIFLDNIRRSYYPRDYEQKKGFSGAAIIAERTFSSPALLLFSRGHPDGISYIGITPDGRNPQRGDPRLNDMLVKLRGEFDVKKQESMIHDILRYYTGQVYDIPRPAVVKAFRVVWPVIGNEGVFISYPGGRNIWVEERLHWWQDSSKPPLARA